MVAAVAVVQHAHDAKILSAERMREWIGKGEGGGRERVRDTGEVDRA